LFVAFAVFGVLLAFAGLVALLSRQVFRPLTALATLTEAELTRQSGARFPRCEAGLARLAGCVARLVDEHRRARACISRLRRSVDARVTQETREIEIMLRHAEREAWRDPLTGLGNRRLLEDRGERLVSDQVERGEDLSIILLDLDNFKVLNDALGHAAGDELLISVGHLLRDSVRGGDMGLRLGGDEFAIILPGERLEKAYETADRLISLFGQQARRYDVRPRLSMSAGVSSLAHHGNVDASSLLSAADEGLYRAKRAGKGRVGVAPDAPAPAPSAQ
jgi:diguanylate cyclase (GGDEF)-like protein